MESRLNTSTLELCLPADWNATLGLTACVVRDSTEHIFEDILSFKVILKCFWGAEKQAIRRTVTISSKMLGTALPSSASIYRDYLWSKANTVSDMRIWLLHWTTKTCMVLMFPHKTGPNCLLLPNPSNFWTQATHRLPNCSGHSHP